MRPSVPLKGTTVKNDPNTAPASGTPTQSLSSDRALRWRAFLDAEALRLTVPADVERWVAEGYLEDTTDPVNGMASFGRTQSKWPQAPVDLDLWVAPEGRSPRFQVMRLDAAGDFDELARGATLEAVLPVLWASLAELGFPVPT